VITAIADTHSEGAHRLSGRARAAVERSSLVVHAGDFTTESALEAVESVATADDGSFRAVHGNSDAPDIIERLPATAVVDALGLRILVVHGHNHDATALSFLGRQEDADLIVVGHTHRPAIDRTPHAVRLNPGSHADPRGPVATHAEITRAAGPTRQIRIRDAEGDVVAETTLTANQRDKTEKR
jgi:hypothetical protein